MTRGSFITGLAEARTVPACSPPWPISFPFRDVTLISMSSIKRDVKEKSFPTTGVEVVSRHPAHLGYASLRAAVAFHPHKIFPRSVTTRSSLGERQVTGVAVCQPWFYPRLMAYDYFWLSEEA